MPLHIDSVYEGAIGQQSYTTSLCNPLYAKDATYRGSCACEMNSIQKIVPLQLATQIVKGPNQCWGSGTGYACFWASRIRVHLSEVWIRIWLRVRILPFSHKGVERTEIMLAK
jgi:hypothetical protein